MNLSSWLSMCQHRYRLLLFLSQESSEITSTIGPIFLNHYPQIPLLQALPGDTKAPPTRPGKSLSPAPKASIPKPIPYNLCFADWPLSPRPGLNS